MLHGPRLAYRILVIQMLSEKEGLVDTAFMLKMGDNDEEIAKSCSYMVKHSIIHAAIWCPNPDNQDEGEWSISVVPIGKVIAAGEQDGMARVSFVTTQGELLSL